MQNLVITRRGQELMSKLIAGMTTAKFTRIAGSDHDYSGVMLEGITELEEVKQTAIISKVSQTDITFVEVLAVLDNSALAEGYYIKALGLYAKDGEGTEILYAVSIEPTAPDYLPAFSGKTVSSISYRLITKVDNSEQVTLEVNPGAFPTVEQVENIQVMIESHIAKNIYGETGVHGFRYYNEVFQVKTGAGEWVDIENGEEGIAPNNVSGLKIKAGNQKLTLSWSDPADTVTDGQTLCVWKGTKLVQKIGSFPENIKDGILLLDNQERDKYKTNGFVLNNLTNETAYYFALFPYSDTGATNLNAANRISGAPKPYRIMTVRIDLSNSNPSSCITYQDDAAGMTAKDSAWDNFFGHYPVLLRNGVEIGKLNRNNFAQFENGKAANITDYNSGDVMIAFPRRGVKISTSGNILTVSMTDNPDEDGFTYYAHTRGTTRKNMFYLGAYKGCAYGTGLYSLADSGVTISYTLEAFRNHAHIKGEGYEITGFYQLVFIQCMYLLKYKNLDSQSAVGQGYVSADTIKRTGATKTKGMDYGTGDQTTQIKLFGLEDFWGNVLEFADGIIINQTNNILTATDSFNSTGSGYKSYGTIAVVSGYLSKPQGTSETGFLPQKASGSTSTYFCDYTSSDTLAYLKTVAFGGHRQYGYSSGIFSATNGYKTSDTNTYVGARLMFL